MNEILDALDRLECTEGDAQLILETIIHDITILKAFGSGAHASGGNVIRVPISVEGGNA